MQNRRFLKLLRYDSKEGFFQNRIKILISILVLCFLCGIAVQDCNLENGQAGYLGNLLYLFKGIPVYKKTSDSEFELPVIWLLYHLYILFLVCTYPSKDVKEYGQQILLFSGNRKKVNAFG